MTRPTSTDAELEELANAAGIEPAEASGHLKDDCRGCQGKTSDQLGRR